MFVQVLGIRSPTHNRPSFKITVNNTGFRLISLESFSEVKVVKQIPLFNLDLLSTFHSNQNYLLITVFKPFSTLLVVAERTFS